MVINRGAARLAALTAGAATVGVLGIGSAYAAGSTGIGVGTTNPLGTTVSGTSSLVTGTAETVTGSVAGSTAKALPGPVAKVVGTVRSTVTTAKGLVDTTVSSLPGESTSAPGSSTGTVGSSTPTTPGTSTRPISLPTRHVSMPVAHHRASMTAVAIDHLNDIAPMQTATIKPVVKDASSIVIPTTVPADAATTDPGLFYGLLHPKALLPEAEHDSRTQLELLALATMLAGAVAAAHLVVARRRLENGEFGWLTGNATGSLMSTPTGWANRANPTTRSALSV